MKEQIEGISLEGRTVRVAVREPLSVEPRTLALAAALRVFERYPVLDRLTVATGSAEVSVSRQELIRRLGSDDLGGVRERPRYRELLNRILAAEALPGGSPAAP